VAKAGQKFGKIFIVLRRSKKILTNSGIFVAILLATLLLTLVRLEETSQQAVEPRSGGETSTWKQLPT
jgi:hypothetical protein